MIPKVVFSVRCTNALYPISTAPVDVFAGDIVGRLRSASLQISHPQISEAHAMLSLRGQRLVLIALRGALGGAGQGAEEIPLETGQTIVLNEEVSLEVIKIELPQRVVGFQWAGQPAVAPAGAVFSVFATDSQLRPGFHADADAHVWRDHNGCWSLQIGQAPSVAVAVGGEPWSIVGRPLRAVWIELGQLESPRTEGRSPVLTISGSQTHLQVSSRGGKLAEISGQGARILWELALHHERGAPFADWELIADQLWGARLNRRSKRARWDMAIKRLRNSLLSLDLERELVQSDGAGACGLVLRPGDRIDLPKLK